MKIIQVIKSIQHIQPIKSTQSQDKQSQNITENFRAIIIDDTFLSDNAKNAYVFIMSYKKPCGLDNFLTKNTVFLTTSFPLH